MWHKNNAVFTEIIVVNKILFVIQCFFRILKEAFRIALYLLLEQAAYLLVQFLFGNADKGSQRGFLTRCLVKEVVSPARHTMCAAFIAVGFHENRNHTAADRYASH